MLLAQTRLFVVHAGFSTDYTGSALKERYYERVFMMMVAHSAQTRTVGKVDGQSLHARWWL